MKIIEKLSDMIADELDGAEAYAKCALKYKDEYPELARTLYAISTQEMEHVNMLHASVVKLIEDHRRTKGEPPAPMMAVYEYLHGKHIEHANKVKSYQEQYRA